MIWWQLQYGTNLHKIIKLDDFSTIRYEHRARTSTSKQYVLNNCIPDGRYICS